MSKWGRRGPGPHTSSQPTREIPTARCAASMLGMASRLKPRARTVTPIRIPVPFIFMACLERQQLVAQRLVVAQRGGGAAEPDRAFLQHVDAIRQAQRKVGVLLGEQDRQPFGLEPRDLLAEVIDDQRRQSLRRLV